MKRLIHQPNLDKLQRGQSLVEMSLGFVLLMIVLSGLLDIGRAYYVFVAMEDGAGEAALYLSLYPECRTEADSPLSAPTQCADPNNAVYRAVNASGANVAWSDGVQSLDTTTPSYLTRVFICQAGVVVCDAEAAVTTITLERPEDYGVGDSVKVTIQHRLDLISPFLPQFTGINPFTMTASASQTIVREKE